MDNKFTILIISLFFVFLGIKTNGQGPYPFNNPELPVDERVDDLVNRMTLEEKASQMINASAAIPRLGIPEYDWWSEALHGLARSGEATVFPQAIGMGATFDEELVHRVASTISDEARANYNAAVAKGYRLKYSGLTFWTPNVNIFRDPRWGRGQETYGEDPYLMGVMGSAFVKGLQGNDPNYLKTAACAKHYAVHSGPEKLRHEFDAIASKQDMYETYLPAFEMLVDAGVESIMGAYNRTNGELCNAHDFLMNEVLREQWGFDGHYLTDCGALVDFYEGHNVVDDSIEAAALAVKYEVNLNCGEVYLNIPKAVEKGLITEAEVDKALKPLLKTRFKLGLFDPAGMSPYDDITYETVSLEQNRELSYEAALKSLVLLKNDGVLPLKSDLHKYFVTGPNASNLEAMLGNYYGVNSNIVTVLEGIVSRVERGSQIQYRMGALLDSFNKNPIDWASGNARNSAATIVVLGLNGLIEGEEGAAIASSTYGDVIDYSMPENQIEYLERLNVGHDNPIITVVIGGSPIDLSRVHELSDAVLMAWYPGQEGGNAVADVIFGNASPSGRLPLTFPKSLEQIPDYTDYSMQGRTYRYMDEEPMYPFGFGLNYSGVQYNSVALLNTSDGEPVKVKVSVTNEGTHDVEEVVQLYISYEEIANATNGFPIFSLKGFDRVELTPGETKELTFTVNREDIKVYNSEGVKVLPEGEIYIYASGSLPVERSVELGASKWVKANL
ncbi:MAG: glycoside hydrolase family 3 C-terminal domain-containing protein [Prolixibacteraceae bacterium]|jgi:beta-glucosidase|nr:glycoside hydrolase family 3 C-terminal domain-containing protein [Prolixibacteraceae bacterium]